MTFTNTVCYDDFSSPKDQKDDIFVADYFPPNLVYVSDTAPVPYDQLTDGAVIWR